jgi:hypothetical protein
MSPDEKTNFTVEHLNILFIYLKITQISELQYCSSSLFLIRGILLIIMTLCCKDNKKIIIDSGVIPYVASLLQFLYPYVFYETQSLSYRYYRARSDLFYRLCENNNSVGNSCLASSFHNVSSYHCGFVIREVVNCCITVLSEFLDVLVERKENIELMFNILKSFLVTHETTIQKPETEADIEKDLKLLVTTCKFIHYFCAVASDEREDEIKNDLERGELGIWFITLNAYDILRRLFVYFNPRDVDPSMDEANVSDREDLLCEVTSSVILMYLYEKTLPDGLLFKYYNFIFFIFYFVLFFFFFVVFFFVNL